MPKPMLHTQLRLDPQGRLVIPATLRKSLGFEPGTTLVARVEDGRLVLETQEQVARRIKARFAHIPREIDLAAELIAERRAEAAREGL